MHYRVRIECYSKQIGQRVERIFRKEYEYKFYVWMGSIYSEFKADDLEQAKEKARQSWKETERFYPDTMKTLKIYEGEVNRLTDMATPPVFESGNLKGL